MSMDDVPVTDSFRDTYWSSGARAQAAVRTDWTASAPARRPTTGTSVSSPWGSSSRGVSYLLDSGVFSIPGECQLMTW